VQGRKAETCNRSVTAERRAPALREHNELNRAELELCAPPAVTEEALLKRILNPRKTGSAGGLFGLKISQFPCVFASLRLCVKDFD